MVRGLIDFDDISYDDHAEFLYKLCGQTIAHLQSYLPNEGDALRHSNKTSSMSGSVAGRDGMSWTSTQGMWCAGVVGG